MADETVEKQGSVTATMSAGTKKDSTANVEGSQAHPQMQKDMLPPREVPALYSKVGLTFGITKSLGNFEFLRVDVTAEDFCAPDKKQETLDALNVVTSDYAVRSIQQGMEYLKNKEISKGK